MKLLLLAQFFAPRLTQKVLRKIFRHYTVFSDRLIKLFRVFHSERPNHSSPASTTGSGDSGTMGGAPFSSAIRIPARIRTAPAMILGPMYSRASHHEVSAANTGSKLMKRAVWLGDVCRCAHT